MSSFDYGKFINRVPPGTNRDLAIALADVFRDLTYRRPTTLWTPTLTCATVGNLTVAYATQVGRVDYISPYLVNVYYRLVCTPTFTTATGEVRIAGMPLVAVNDSAYFAVGSGFISGFTLPAGYTSVAPIIRDAGSSSQVAVQKYGSGVAAANLLITEAASGVAITIVSSINLRI
jgi:hypothetical protein